MNENNEDLARQSSRSFYLIDRDLEDIASALDACIPLVRGFSSVKMHQSDPDAPFPFSTSFKEALPQHHDMIFPRTDEEIPPLSRQPPQSGQSVTFFSRPPGPYMTFRRDFFRRTSGSEAAESPSRADEGDFMLHHSPKVPRQKELKSLIWSALNRHMTNKATAEVEWPECRLTPNGADRGRVWVGFHALEWAREQPNGVISYSEGWVLPPGVSWEMPNIAEILQKKVRTKSRFAIVPKERVRADTR